MAASAGECRRTQALGVIERRQIVAATAIVAAAAAAAISWLSGGALRTAIIAGSLALVIGAIVACAAIRPIDRQLRNAIAELMVVEGELVRVNLRLEQHVGLRTSELIDANRQLRAEMERRTQIELELRQAQKLEAVGALAAGIAHEINTPVQFISDSCGFLETSSTDLLAVIAGYRDTFGELVGALGSEHPAIAAATSRIHAIEAERDVAYLTEQIPLAIARALQGLNRVSTIVHAMKDFAYPDRNEQVPADLNRAILSTLTVARNEYKYIAEINTDLAELPPVTCHIGELNQVILNMVVNSAHAIAAVQSDGDRAGMIAIRTRVNGANVEIEIEDNGCGIPEAALDRIFDPFFTTKEIGKGTGQGLAIARAVVIEKHAGKIDVTSRVGHGTTFSITLPVLGRETAGGRDDALTAAAS
jgi:signal transduction histidine kinase